MFVCAFLVFIFVYITGFCYFIYDFAFCILFFRYRQIQAQSERGEYTVKKYTARVEAKYLKQKEEARLLKIQKRPDAKAAQALARQNEQREIDRVHWSTYVIFYLYLWFGGFVTIFL